MSLVGDKLVARGAGDIGIAGCNTRRYRAIYRDLQAGRIDEAEARDRIGKIFRTREYATEHDTYGRYYSESYEEHCDATYPGLRPNERAPDPNAASQRP